jgi:hypothetical protein
MDERRIFIANLAKGRIGPGNSDLLGSLLVQRFMIAGMERSDTPAEERAAFALYVDEFQNFATDTFGDILSEARKFGFSLMIANQYLGQLDPAVLDAVIGLPPKSVITFDRNTQYAGASEITARREVYWRGGEL